MELVKHIDQIKANLKALEEYLIRGNQKEQEAAHLLIKKGNCYIAYHNAGEFRFAPSRFVGYQNNTLQKHHAAKWAGEVDGRDTNPKITEALGLKLIVSEELNQQLILYGNSLGLKVDNRKHSFWPLELEGLPNKLKRKKEMGYEEGSISYRMHQRRERNSALVRNAKEAFKAQHGHLFCEACHFDFEKQYGTRGQDYIEAHHRIPISQLKPNQKTRVEDLIMLCANCHRMIHRGESGESLKDFKQILYR